MSPDNFNRLIDILSEDAARVGRYEGMHHGRVPENEYGIYCNAMRSVREVRASLKAGLAALGNQPQEPPTRAPLTDERIDELVKEHTGLEDCQGPAEPTWRADGGVVPRVWLRDLVRAAISEGVAR